MSANLKKGQNISLVKPGGNPLNKIVVACGWDVNPNARGGFLSRQASYDLDLSAAGLDSSGKVPRQNDPTDRAYPEWFVYANHRHPSNRSILFGGDNRTGKGDGDDELIKVDLPQVPATIERIIFAVVIWQAAERGNQRFGMIENAFIRIYDERSGEEIARYDLSNDFTNETLVMFGELYRRDSEWKFRAVGQGYHAGHYREEFGIGPEFEREYARYRN